MVKVSVDLRRLESSAKAAFRDACLLAHREMIQVISEPGAFPGFPGDIVDTGALRAAQQPPEFSEGGSVATFRNTTEYALYVYLGYTLRNGREQRGRPWMQEAFNKMDFERTLAMLLKAKL